MAIIRWNPFTEFDRALARSNWYGPEDYEYPDWSPSVDIFDDESQIVLTAELPGMSQDDVKVNLENNVLTISGTREFKEEETKGKYTRRERYFGKFTRSFRVPNTVDRGKIEAKMDKGILTVTLPKTDDAQPKQIEVKVH